MVQFSTPFNASGIAPLQSYQPLPEGWYLAKVTESEQRTSSKGDPYIALTLEIMAGDHASRKVFDNLNLWHQNAVAQEIAQRSLSGYCHATGQIQLADTAQLHNHPIMIKVKETPARNGYEAGNSVSEILSPAAYQEKHGALPGQQVSPAMGAAPAPVTAQEVSQAPFPQTSAPAAAPAAVTTPTTPAVGDPMANGVATNAAPLPTQTPTATSSVPPAAAGSPANTSQPTVGEPAAAKTVSSPSNTASTPPWAGM